MFSVCPADSFQNFIIGILGTSRLQWDARGSIAYVRLTTAREDPETEEKKKTMTQLRHVAQYLGEVVVAGGHN